MSRRISVRGVVLHDGQLLAVRLKPYKAHLKQNNNYWCLPGGGLDLGESLVEGVAREMFEETGVKPVVGNLLYVQQFAIGDVEYLEFFFHITNSEDYISIDLSQASHGAEEIEEVRFINPKDERILPEFLTTEQLEHHAKNAIAKIVSSL